MKEIHLVVGPNGAGKTTFVEFTLQPLMPALPFVNADVIAKVRWPDAPEAHSYEAARIAEATRDTFIETGRAFIAETVFSHPSKIDIARNARHHGYAVHLHVVMVIEDMSVARVQHRVESGGHSVPEEKIRDRYRRLWANVAETVRHTTTAAFYDNTQKGSPVRVAFFADGYPLGPATWPSWTPTELTSLWTTHGGADA